MSAIKGFLPQVEQDPVVLALAPSQVLGPRREEDIKAHLKAWSNALLGLAICLREGVDGGGNAPVGVDGMTTNQYDDDKTKRLSEPSKRTPSGGSTNVQTAQHHTAQMGITFNKQYQGKGYGREAINWMVNWAFRHAGLHTVTVTLAHRELQSKGHSSISEHQIQAPRQEERDYYLLR
ncbi:hypothetical protein E4U58_006311 [Claviceps cyperi]|nr:hypothetical protein E4U58_006311 [Claviceps cyperi]